MNRSISFEPDGICPPGLDELLAWLLKHYPHPPKPEPGPEPYWITSEILAATTIYHMANMIADSEVRSQLRTAAAGVLAQGAQQLEHQAGMQK